MANVVEVDRAGDIAILRFNRPDNLNALSLALGRGIATSLIELDGDDTVRGIVLTGTGDRAFCAGVDLHEARGMQVADIESWFGTACNVYRQILLTNKPVIAAVNGIAAGGGFQMALVSDLRVSHAGARMGQPEINAAIPSIMGSYWMSLHLGWSKNQELSMTGRLMPADEAHGLGLINYMVEQDQVVAKACEVAETLAGKPSVAWARTKARFREIALAGFDEAFRVGVLEQQEAYATGQAQAVIEAFLASRGSGKA